VLGTLANKCYCSLSSKFSVPELFQTELYGRTYRPPIGDATSCRDATHCLLFAHLREGVIDYYYDAGMPVPAVN